MRTTRIGHVLVCCMVPVKVCQRASCTVHTAGVQHAAGLASAAGAGPLNSFAALAATAADERVPPQSLPISIICPLS